MQETAIRRQDRSDLAFPSGPGPARQQALVKYFLIVSLLFLAQVLVGAAAAHNRAEPGTFFGFGLYELLPTNILRTWHLQLGIFWIATSYVAGGMLLGTALGEREPRGQKTWVHLLFWALVAVVGGSLLGELLGINQVFGSLWSWFGHQGWEYLDLGRVWQVGLNMALSSFFSAMEVVPLTLLTLDAWDFVRLTRRQGEEGGSGHPIPHKWVFYFLMAVGFRNFVGAGIFGFLINLPIVSYYEIGTMLTPNHGHAAMMGVFGMEAVALMLGETSSREA